MSKAKLISETFVRPQFEVHESKRVHHLNPFDLRHISVDYQQPGFLYAKPENFTPSSYLHTLKSSLSRALVYSYPLAGRLVTVLNKSDHSSYIYVDCAKGPGARLIHASAHDLTMAQVVSLNSDVPKLIWSFFELGETAVNHDGHTRPLLTAQVTELKDGVFLGFSFNHSVIDGYSVFFFLRIWSHLFMDTLSSKIPLQIVRRPDFLDGRIFKLPFLDPSEFITRPRTDLELRERIFHFSPQSLQKLKALANSEANNTTSISTFIALTAFVWKCITRVRALRSDELTMCALPINLRPRFNPPLSNDHFGNYTVKAREPTKVGDLLGNSLAWTAALLQRSIDVLDDKAARAMVLQALNHGPHLAPTSHTSRSSNLVVGSSNKFNANTIKFGLGPLTGYRAGYANQVEGKVNASLGLEGDGSVDLDICLAPDTMAALLLDQEFMGFVSKHNHHLNLISKI